MAAVKVTPLVLLNIADHFTRNRVQKISQNQRVIGALMGKKQDRQIKITLSYELIYELDNTTECVKSVDIQNFLTTKQEVLTTDNAGNHFKDLEFIGWYSTSKDLQIYKTDMEFHQLFSQFKKSKIKEEGELKEDALYLLLDPYSQNSVDIPIQIFESKKEKGQQMQFSPLEFEIDAEKSETISIESAQKNYDSMGTSSQFSENLNTTLQAVKRFNEKIEQILKQLENPRMTKNMVLIRYIILAQKFEFYRELNEILNSFPVQFHNSLNDRLLEQYSDSNIISFFSAITAAHRIINDVSTQKYRSNNLGFKGGRTQDFI